MLGTLSKLLKKSYQKGFTLIELLVVLGILGILAAALLAAINPVEQLNKAQDTSLKNTASEFISSTVQYYSAHNELPWTSSGCYSGGTTFSAVSLTSLKGCLSNVLIPEGELKSSFINASNLGKIYVTNTTGDANDTMACFLPQSHAQQVDSNTKYVDDAGSTTGNSSCISQGGSTKCYWCAQ
ncbi:MAG TPA: prepilin-type N-terminal cleavage/methylation domain-containing protein [Candidatus Acidoferrales bacterium]|nr:prepilin-type N-terminal cleavage/methylation domain-containing protein [Candidatus Acidoferrales bacterium]